MTGWGWCGPLCPWARFTPGREGTFRLLHRLLAQVERILFPVFRQYPQYNCPAHHRDLGRDGRGGRCDRGGWEMVEAYLSLLEMGHYELKIAFEGLADENVWKRPAAGLLS